MIDREPTDLIQQVDSSPDDHSFDRSNRRASLAHTYTIAARRCHRRRHSSSSSSSVAAAAAIVCRARIQASWSASLVAAGVNRRRAIEATLRGPIERRHHYCGRARSRVSACARARVRRLRRSRSVVGICFCDQSPKHDSSAASRRLLQQRTRDRSRCI
jgi:hypothetical protein